MWKEFCVNILEGILVDDSFRALSLRVGEWVVKEKRKKNNLQS
jgi:hypothetical protein